MDRVEQFVLSGPSVASFCTSAENRITQKQLKVNLEPKMGIIEVPDFCLRDVTNCINRDYDYILFNMCAIGSPIARRVMKGVLSDFMKAPRFRRIASVHMTSGGTYYGAPGLILDSEFNILMLMTTTLRIIPEVSGSNNTFKILGHNCRVSSRTFNNADKIVEKTIIKKVIPFCASHNVGEDDYIFFSDRCLELKNNKTIKVIIDDVDARFMHQVVPPKLSDNTTEIVQDILKKSIATILQ